MRRILLCCVVGLLGATPVQGQTLHLAANERLAEQFVASRMLRVIYAKAGLNLDIEPMPAARANLETVQGQRDGEIARIAAYGERNPTLIRVDLPYYHLTSRAFWMKARNASVASRADLKHYSVGAIRGVAHSMELTEGHPSVTLTKEPMQMFRMLRGGRFDLALDTGINGRYLVSKNRWQDIDFSPDLARLDLYHYLHPRHSALAARLEQAIRQMRSSGELDQARTQAENELLTTQLDQFTGPQK